jgi:hypothetical protein
MSGRIYTVAVKGVSVSAAQDVIAVYAGASMAFEVIGFTIGTEQGTSVAGEPISLNRLGATVTAGSGGAAGALAGDRSTDAAATVTARINDTTQATTSGSTDALHADVLNLSNGYPWVFPRDARPVAKPGEAIVLSLDSAPPTPVAFSAALKIRELF